MDYSSYIAPELLVLVPVLYLLGMALKKSGIRDKFIPITLGAASVLLCTLWIFGSSSVFGLHQFFSALFSSLTQGILIAGSAVYTNQLIVQASKKE